MSEVTPDSAETVSLLAQIGADDRRAFERLFARHRPYLRRVTAARLDRRARARVDPSDVVQDTQLEAYRRLPDYLVLRPMPFRLWLCKTAHERVLVVRRQHIEARRRAVTREESLTDRSELVRDRSSRADDSTPSRNLCRSELVQRVRQAMARLPEADRQILLLRTDRGLSNREAAAVLGLDPATASKRHGRAVLRLHRVLVESGLTESQL